MMSDRPVLVRRLSRGTAETALLRSGAGPEQPSANGHARSVSSAAAGPERSNEAEGVRFVVDGWPCRVVRVDDCLPQHDAALGSGRTRLRYLVNEVAHFQLGEHRYALVADVTPASGAEESGSGDVMAVLSNRELQIVQLICMGLLTKQVADRLALSEFTVRSYLKTIYCKLGVRSRGAMVYAYARALGVQREAAR